MKLDYNIYTVIYLSQILALLGIYAVLLRRGAPSRIAAYFERKAGGGSKTRLFGAGVMSFLTLCSPIFLVTFAAGLISAGTRSPGRGLPFAGLLVSTLMLNMLYAGFLGGSFLLFSSFKLRSNLQKAVVGSIICLSAALFFNVAAGRVANSRADAGVAQIQSGPLKTQIREFLSETIYSDVSLSVVKNEQLNAYANPEGIYLMEGLIKNLNASEINSVVAHEVAHIHNQDSEVAALLLFGVFTLCAALMGYFTIRKRFGLDHGAFGSAAANGFGVFVLFFLLCLPLAKAGWTQFKRANEALADAAAVEYLLFRGARTEDFESALAKTSGTLAEPTLLTDLLMYDHPPYAKRVENIRAAKAKLTGAE